MSNNIFGDDDDDFQLLDGNDVGKPTIQSRPVATPQPVQEQPKLPVRRPVDNVVPVTRRTMRNLPEAAQVAPPAVRNTLPSRPNTQNTNLPAVSRGLPTQPSVHQQPVQQVEEKPVVQQPVYQAPEPTYVTPEPEERYPEPTPEPVYRTPEPVSYREPTPRAVPRPAKQVDLEPEIEFDEPEETKGNSGKQRGRKAKAVTQKPKKGKAAQDTSEKAPSRFRGARKSVLVIRIIAGVVIAVFVATGAKTIFFPVAFPNSTVVTNVVKKNLGITAFPVEAGNQFVLSFTKDYLTIDPTTRSARTDVLKKYTSDSLASKLSSNNNTDKATQTVIGDPIITSVKSISDAEAVYTVAAQVTANNWLYLAIPVYFDKTVNGYTISGTPAFVVTPAKAGKPDIPSPFTNDSKIANVAQANVQSFFIAWSTSNTQDLSLLLTEDATIDAKAGLHGSLKFVKVNDFSVEKKTDIDPTANERKAQASIIWANPNNPDITYEQTYNLVIFKQPNDKWYISSIEGGAPETKASSS